MNLLRVLITISFCLSCNVFAETFNGELVLSATKPDPACVAGAVLENVVVDCAGIELGLGCASDDEGQPPVITLKNATIKNLVISASGGADGIHCSDGDCVLENVVWLDICEDAATLEKTGKSLTIIGGAAYNFAEGPGGKPDKVFQHNAKDSTIIVKDGFTLFGMHGKLWRSCGNCTNNGGPRHLVLEDIVIDSSIYSIAGLNRNYGDTATMRNIKIKNYREGKPKVCEEYKGIMKNGDEESAAYGEKWDTESCRVSKSNIVVF
jgi:hypothetical protein